MANPAGESYDGAIRLGFDRRLMLQFRGSVVTSDAGLLAYRDLADALGLSAMAGDALSDAPPGKNGQHALVGMLRQSIFGRLAGYEDVNDAQRLRDDPAMRWIVGGKAASGAAASPRQMRRAGSRRKRTFRRSWHLSSLLYFGVGIVPAKKKLVLQFLLTNVEFRKGSP